MGQTEFKLTKLPMPPSSNHQYAARSFPNKHAKNYGGEKRQNFSLAKICPTSELERYEKRVKMEWKKANEVAVYTCSRLLKDWMLKGFYIEIETFAFFDYFQLFTQEGLPRRMDGSNRIKALHDCMAEILEIDDSWFWDTIIRKRETKSKEPWCAVRFRPVTHMGLGEMKEKGIL